MKPVTLVFFENQKIDQSLLGKILLKKMGVVEPEKKKVLVNQFITSIFNGIRVLNTKLNMDVIQIHDKELKTTHFVGIIKLKSCIIQILPKIFRKTRDYNIDSMLNDDEIAAALNALLTIISYTDYNPKKNKMNGIGLLGSKNLNLFEGYVSYFISQLEYTLSHNINRNYHLEIDDPQYIKGIFLRKEYLRQNYHNKPQNLLCEFDEFDQTTTINLILKWTLTMIKSWRNSILISKKVENILHNYFFNVPLKEIHENDWDTIHYNRLNEEYRPLINFCYLFLHNQCIISGQKLELYFLIFDMNKLFEDFLTKFIIRQYSKLSIQLNGLNYSIYPEQPQKLCGKIFGKFHLKPDLVIMFKGNGQKDFLILDFKYKKLKTDENDYEIPRSDVYQMFSYLEGCKYNSKHGLLLYALNSKEKIEPLKTYKHINPDLNLYVNCIDFEETMANLNQDDWETKMIDSFNILLNFSS